MKIRKLSLNCVHEVNVPIQWKEGRVSSRHFAGIFLSAKKTIKEDFWYQKY